MLQQYHTKLKGTLALTDSYLTEKALQREKGLYKFIWVRNGSITVEIDHQEMVLMEKMESRLLLGCQRILMEFTIGHSMENGFWIVTKKSKVKS